MDRTPMSGAAGGLTSGADPRCRAVVGASGYVGRRLVARLSEEGHRVRALSRHAEGLAVGPGVERWSIDVSDVDQTTLALQGVGTAYYLVHAMADGSAFPERDRDNARAFARAAHQSGVQCIVYVGALGGGGAHSEHLASRHEVGDLLRSTEVPVVELRAAVVLGAGSISFEMLRYLTERLPVMVCPRWVKTRLQPLAERDLLTYLVRAPDVAPGVYELGTPDVTTYLDMMRAYAQTRGLRRRRIVTIPLLTPSLSAHWVDLVTPVNREVSHALVQSLRFDVVVHDHETAAAAFGVDPLPVAEAIDAALSEQAARIPATLFRRSPGLDDGVYTMLAKSELSVDEAEAVRADLLLAGADLDWYGARHAWRLRILLGSLLDEQLALARPERMETGSDVDWWTVAARDPDSLVLASRSWRFGDAWLGYRVEVPTKQRRGSVIQAAAFRPKGVAGLAYWRLLWPVHLVVFRAMVRRRRARVMAPTARRHRGVRRLVRRSAPVLPPGTP